MGTADMNLWKEGLAQVLVQAPSQLKNLGNGSGKSKRKKAGYRQVVDQVEIYRHIQRGRYKFSHLNWSRRMICNYATVEVVSPGKCKVVSVTPPPGIHT